MSTFPFLDSALTCTYGDAELIAAARSGDHDAFAVLMSRHHHRINAIATRMCGANDRLDVAQESALRVWRSLSLFRGECSVATWIHRITVNVCLDRLRAGAPTIAVEETTDWADPQDHYLVVELRQTVVAALRALPVEQREAIVMVDVRGWTLAQAAQVLECPVGTVKSRCARGRVKLAALLGEPVH